MKLSEIVNQIMSITNDMQNRVMFSNDLDAQKKRTAAKLLISIVEPLKFNVINASTPSKTKVKTALRSLKKVASDYNIKEDLKKSLADMKAYLDSLG